MYLYIQVQIMMKHVKGLQLGSDQSNKIYAYYALTHCCLARLLQRHFIILKSISLLSRPVKRNRPVTISKTVHPALHTSERIV